MFSVLSKKFLVFIVVFFSSNIALAEETETEIEATKRSYKMGIALSVGEDKVGGDEFKSTSQINHSFKVYLEDKLDPNFYGETGKAVLSAFGGLAARLDLESTYMNAKAGPNALFLERGVKTSVSTSTWSGMLCTLSDTNFRICPSLGQAHVRVYQKDFTTQSYSASVYGLDTSYRYPLENNELAIVGGINWKAYEVGQKFHGQSSNFSSSRVALYAGMEF